jgi:hypothetical protein
MPSSHVRRHAALADTDLDIWRCTRSGAGAGKSSIMLRYADGTFSDTYISTIGIDLKIRLAHLGGETAKVHTYPAPAR